MKQDAFPNCQFDVVVPDLGEGSDPVQFVIWLVPIGARVIPGERLAELLTQGVVLHLEASQEGVLTKQIARPGHQIQSGDVIGRIRTTE